MARTLKTPIAYATDQEDSGRDLEIFERFEKDDLYQILGWESANLERFGMIPKNLKDLERFWKIQREIKNLREIKKKKIRKESERSLSEGIGKIQRN